MIELYTKEYFKIAGCKKVINRCLVRMSQCWVGMVWENTTLFYSDKINPEHKSYTKVPSLILIRFITGRVLKAHLF